MAEGLADVRRGAVHSIPSRRYKAAAAVLRAVPRGTVRAMGNTGFRRKPVVGDVSTQPKAAHQVFAPDGDALDGDITNVDTGVAQ